MVQALPGPAPAAGLVGALRAALVLLADHELAASTLAARVAASVRADPYAWSATGLARSAGRCTAAPRSAPSRCWPRQGPDEVPPGGR